MFEKITEKISSSFKKLRGNSVISESNIEDSLKEIRLSLLEADVNYKVVKELIDKKNLKVEIEIDGGINFQNCTEAKKAGANVLVSGSTIFKENQGDLEKNIGILRKN